MGVILSQEVIALSAYYPKAKRRCDEKGETLAYIAASIS